MDYSKKEVIGHFSVVDNKRERKQVIVSQEVITHYSGTANHSKSLSLDSLDGPEVYKTEDPSLFKLLDGTILRKISS